MAKPTTKTELIELAENNYNKLKSTIDSLSIEE
jgi:hypothetical protein